MTESRYDQYELPLTCPRCGHETKKTIGWMKRHRQFACQCGVIFDSEELVRGFEKVGRSIDQFKRNIRRKNR